MMAEEDALKIAKRGGGGASYEVAINLSNIGSYQLSLGNQKKAQANLTRSIQTFERLLGKRGNKSIFLADLPKATSDAYFNAVTNVINIYLMV